jgi:hypothetical protein
MKKRGLFIFILLVFLIIIGIVFSVRGFLSGSNKNAGYRFDKTMMTFVKD